MSMPFFGSTEFAEHELELNKLLTGLEAGTPIALPVELTQIEKELVDQLLAGVTQLRSKLGETSRDGLRGKFPDSYSHS